MQQGCQNDQRCSSSPYRVLSGAETYDHSPCPEQYFPRVCYAVVLQSCGSARRIPKKRALEGLRLQMRAGIGSLEAWATITFECFGILFIDVQVWIRSVSVSCYLYPVLCIEFLNRPSVWTELDAVLFSYSLWQKGPCVRGG